MTVLTLNPATAETKSASATIVMSPEELATVTNALNEVCNGLDLPEFSTRLGVSREEAVELLHQFTIVSDQSADLKPASR